MLENMTEAGPSMALPLRGLRNSRNWGDRIGGWIAERLSGVSPQWVEVLDGEARSHPHLLTVGSILRFATSTSVVWGSGFICAEDALGATAWRGGPYEAASPEVLAVRGPRSRARLAALGVEAPAIYGDPVMLMPRLYTAEREVQHPVGVICHYADANDDRLARLRADPRFHFIDIMQFDLLRTVRELLTCERIVSTSLHGLVLADAYRLPARWLRMMVRPGDPNAWAREHWATFKFEDHLQAVGRGALECLEARTTIAPDDLLEAARAADEVPVRYDDRALLDACPFAHRTPAPMRPRP